MTTQVRMGRSGREAYLDKLAVDVHERIMKQLAVKQSGQKHDASGTPTSTGFMHGPGGILSYPGVDPDVFSTIIGPFGLLSQLPSRPTTNVYPLFANLTGITSDEVASGGSEPAEPCDDAPTAGQRESCLTFAPFGLVKRGTVELEINRLGQTNDRADPMDLQLVNSPIGDALFGGSNAAFGFTAQSLQNEMIARMQDRAMAMHLKLSQMLWSGTPANNNAGGGYKEFPGLERLVSTGHVDAITNTSCSSMDSDVKDFNFGSVQANGNDLVNALTYEFRFVRARALRSGINVGRWAFCMREELFYELTKIWPVSYLLGATTVIDGNGQRLTLDAKDQIDMRDAMRSGRYLVLDGIQVQVIFDDAIPYDDGNSSGGNFPSGCYASDIYLLPMSANGRSTLFLEYFQFQNPSIQTVLGMPVLARVDGAFLETPRQTNQCVVFDIKIEPRVILRTPWLAAKLTNVVYCPMQLIPSAFPNDPYARNSGVTNRAGPSYYNPTPWQS